MRAAECRLLPVCAGAAGLFLWCVAAGIWLFWPVWAAVVLWAAGLFLYLLRGPEHTASL